MRIGIVCISIRSTLVAEIRKLMMARNGDEMGVARNMRTNNYGFVLSLCLIGGFLYSACCSSEEEMTSPRQWFETAIHGRLRTLPGELIDKYGVQLFDEIEPYLKSENSEEYRAAIDYVSMLFLRLENPIDRDLLTERVLDSLGEKAIPSELLKLFSLLDATDYTSQMKAKIGAAIARDLGRVSLSVEEQKAAIVMLSRGMITDRRELLRPYWRNATFSSIDFASKDWELYWTALCTSARFGDKSALRTAIRLYESAGAPLPKYEPMLASLASTRQPELLDILIPLLDAEGWVYEPSGDVLGQSIKQQAFQLTLSFFDDLPTDISADEMIDWLKEHYKDASLPPIVYTYRTPWIPDSPKAIIYYPPTK